MSDQKRAYAAIAAALDGVKPRDAQTLAEAETALKDLDAEIAGIAVKIAASTAEMADAPLSDTAAFFAWRRAQERRRDALSAKRPALEAEIETRREALKQSNGEAMAADRLLEQAKAAAIAAAAKSAARRR